MRSLSLYRSSVIAGALAVVFHFAAASAWAVFTDQSAAILGGANYTTRSASLADYDGDGDLDLMFQTSAGPKLYRNNFINTGGTAAMTYTDVTSTMLPAGMNLWHVERGVGRLQRRWKSRRFCWRFERTRARC